MGRPAAAPPLRDPDRAEHGLRFSAGPQRPGRARRAPGRPPGLGRGPDPPPAGHSAHRRGDEAVLRPTRIRVVRIGRHGPRTRRAGAGLRRNDPPRPGRAHRTPRRSDPDRPGGRDRPQGPPAVRQADAGHHLQQEFPVVGPGDRKGKGERRGVTKQVLTLRVNGEEHSLAVSPNETLLEVLREDLELTGVKEGCGEGACGTCTVLMDGVPRRACLTLALEAAGQEVITVEGLARAGELTPLQRSFVDGHAIQCGFCTPGMLIAGTHLLQNNPRPTETEVRKALAGHVCRCTGYAKIVKATLAAAEES
ncbi:MAG: 2Fe-2S iron-sulfur cluster binding domain-containing protein [Proteobacteria bacterium]|nr:2Fe-2S iron-sulfur cluster binding domain-containing protein [Pseudomonadota bacterium]